MLSGRYFNKNMFESFSSALNKPANSIFTSSFSNNFTVTTNPFVSDHTKKSALDELRDEEENKKLEDKTKEEDSIDELEDEDDEEDPEWDAQVSLILYKIV